MLCPFKGYGFSTLPTTAVTPDTLFYGGSTTKAMVAAALAKLIASGKYPELAQGWSTKISSILPEDFVLGDEWATRHLTLEDAAAHRTGMPRHDRASPRIIQGEQATPRDVVRSLRNLALNAEPRTKFQYCNSMYIVLGHVIETITNKPLADVLKEEIWDPLGMKSTFLAVSPLKPDNEDLATGHYWDKEAKAYKSVPIAEMTEIAAAGAVVSNVQDYARWISCLMHRGATFSESVHDDIRAPRVVATTQPSRGCDVALYSLGWARTTYKGHVLYNHSGGTTAFSSQAYWLPDLKFGVVSFANTVWSGNAVQDVIVWRLIADKLGIPENERADIGAG